MRFDNRRIQFGFSLLEISIVLAILSFLILFAYPSYASHLQKVRRIDGQKALYNLAVQFEKSAFNDFPAPAVQNIHERSAQGYYDVYVVQSDTQHYLIAAKPVGIQLNDKQCGTLAMDDQGRKGRLVGAELVQDKSCW